VTGRSVVRRIDALAMSEGAGVTVRRTIGLPALRHLDPFLMLDQFSSDNPDDYIAGFPDHPHRGFVTLTYMVDGHMEHRDSMGNHSDLRAGGVQWMKAASGVIHSEMPGQTDGLVRGFQLWINLPAVEKMTEPAYQEFAADHVPAVIEPPATVRILSGEFAGRHGPIQDPHTELLYLDVTVPAGERFVHRINRGLSTFVYPFEGTIGMGGTSVPARQIAVLGDGDTVDITANGEQSRFLLVAGRPLDEPVVQYGPFVMNTRGEIEQALADYRDGRLASKAATVNR
jgi:redox-sensitive bicupin YhaK (pirin superfamily)